MLEDIDKACRKHIEKQKWGQLSTTLRFQNTSEVGKLIMTRNKLLEFGQHQSEEFKEIEGKMATIMETLRRRAPDDRHKARTEALYVEPDSSGIDWNRPKKVEPELARNFVADASGDYALIRQIIELSTSSNEEFTKELLKWKDRPEILLAKWPQWPTS